MVRVYWFVVLFFDNVGLSTVGKLLLSLEKCHCQYQLATFNAPPLVFGFGGYISACPFFYFFLCVIGFVWSICQ